MATARLDSWPCQERVRKLSFDFLNVVLHTVSCCGGREGPRSKGSADRHGHVPRMTGRRWMRVDARGGGPREVRRMDWRVYAWRAGEEEAISLASSGLLGALLLGPCAVHRRAGSCTLACKP